MAFLVQILRRLSDFNSAKGRTKCSRDASHPQLLENKIRKSDAADQAISRFEGSRFIHQGRYKKDAGYEVENKSPAR